MRPGGPGECDCTRGVLDHGIRVNCLAPNAATRMVQSVDPATLERLMPIVGKFYSAMSPDFVTHLLAVYLASRDCPHHGIYSAMGGRYAHIFIGVTEGLVWAAR